MRKIRKGRQSLRKALEVPNEIFRQAVNLTVEGQPGVRNSHRKTDQGTSYKARWMY